MVAPVDPLSLLAAPGLANPISAPSAADSGGTLLQQAPFAVGDGAATGSGAIRAGDTVSLAVAAAAALALIWLARR